MSGMWNLWTDAELAESFQIWSKAVEQGFCRADNRIDLLVADIEAEIARRAA